MRSTYTTTITTKGQITIPKSVRDRLGIRRGTTIDIGVVPDGFIGTVQRKPARRP